MTKDFLSELDSELKNEILPKVEEQIKKSNPESSNLNAENKKSSDYINSKNPNHKSYKNNDGSTINNSYSRNKKPSNYSWDLVVSKHTPLKFPETKFYLPSLREGYTRFIPIGWNNETWAKNMGMCQYDEDILIIDCWVQFPDQSMLWVNYSIPDISFLTKYKKNIKWILITHAHLDHIWALKHVLPALWMPPIYWTRFTIGLIKKSLDEYGLLNDTTLIEVDAGSKTKIPIWKFEVEFFRVNHSIPDCAWLYIESPGWAKFVHTWDFKIDFTPEIDKPADLARIGEIGERWITLFLSDSTGSTRKWSTVSEKEVWEALEKIVESHKKWRLIIATFSSWISRVQQLINIADKYWKTIFLSGRSMIENVDIAKDLGYLKMKPGIIKKMTAKATQWVPAHNQIIITTWSQGEQFSALSRMAEWRHNALEIIKWDTIVFSSSTVPWNEKSVVWIINKLIKLWAAVITKDDWEIHTWGHAFQEEQKMMFSLVKPKYFMPVFWDLYFRTVHKNNICATWFKEDNVLLLDNGQIVDFAPKNWNVFKSRIKAPIQEIVIDGHGIGLATSHVIQARQVMQDSGVLVILFKVDKNSKAIIGHIKLETRWLVYLEEVRYIHRIIIKKARMIYENTIKDVPEIEIKDLNKIIKSDLESFLVQKIDRAPMIIPMIIEV